MKNKNSNNGIEELALTLETPLAQQGADEARRALLLEANDLSRNQIYSIFDEAHCYSNKACLDTLNSRGMLALDNKSDLTAGLQKQASLEMSLYGKRRAIPLVALAFFENSTRTRLSFEIAAKHLGLNVINFTAGNSSLSKGESLADTIRTMDAMKVDMYIIRSQYSGVPKFVSKITNSAIINAGDGRHEHPTQALLDAYTIFQHYKQFEGLKVCIVGDILHSRVARSNITMLQELGAEVRLFAPGTLQGHCPWPFTSDSASSVLATTNEVVDWSDVIIMLRLQNERMDKGFLPSVSEYVRFYQMNFENFTRKDKIILLHPGPVNYGVELDHRIAKLHNCLINKQVENGVFIRMAVISQLLGLS